MIGPGDGSDVWCDDCRSYVHREGCPSYRMKIRIDRQEFDVLETLYRPKGFSSLPPTPTATGEDIQRLGGHNPIYSVTLLGERWEGNRDIGHSEAVILFDGAHFITVPPATYWAGR